MLVGSLDLPDMAAPSARHGVLLVTGGRETRFGSHRLYERLAAGLAAAGHPAFRFDRRGTGDSGGEDPGYAGSGPDIAAALAAFRAACPDLAGVVGFGLCDGATALALHAPALDGLVLANPWLVEPVDDLPPAAAIGRHYRTAILAPATWRRALTGGIDLRKALRGTARLLRPREQHDLAEATLARLARATCPIVMLLADGDGTAQAAAAALKRYGPQRLPGTTLMPVATASHSFAGAADFEALLRAIRTLAAPTG